VENRKSVIRSWTSAQEKIQILTIKSPQVEIFFHAKCLNLETAEYEHNYSRCCLEDKDFVKCHKLPLNVFEIFEDELRKFNSILHGLFLLRLRVERYEINETTGFENVLLQITAKS
jgi:hypothetical protein